jgi:hypothetical protein
MLFYKDLFIGQELTKMILGEKLVMLVSQKVKICDIHICNIL